MSLCPHASSKRWALSNQIDKLSINSVWLKEQLSSVNKALDSILSIRSNQTVWYRSGKAPSNTSWALAS